MDTPNDLSEIPLKHCRVVHAIRRRVRVLAPSLRKDRERAYILEILLRKRAGIKKVRAVADIASVSVRFDPRQLDRRSLLIYLDAVIGNLGQGHANASLSQVEIDPKLPERELNLAVEGMTCASCALLIEMILKRDPRISAARVNFATETAVARGHITPENLSSLIADIGYQAHDLDSLAQRRLMIDRDRQRLADAKRRAIWATAFSVPDGHWHDDAHDAALALVAASTGRARGVLGGMAVLRKSLQTRPAGSLEHGLPDYPGGRLLLWL